MGRRASPPLERFLRQPPISAKGGLSSAGDSALSDQRADVAIIMGSQSDWMTMQHAAETLKALQVSHKSLIVSAHRTPERLYEFARGRSEERRVGTECRSR